MEASVFHKTLIIAQIQFNYQSFHLDLDFINQINR